jgi:DNA-directed RNA polymerase specialized sigma24 family protein
VGVMAGDSGFDTIVAEHHAEIYRYLLRMTGATPTADNLSQETFLRVYRAYRNLPAEANARARLFRIATNLSRKHLRGGGRQQPAHGALTAIEGAVTMLPFKQRAAFLQRKLHMLDYAAIGESLRCSIESARALVLHALRRIRQALDGQESRASREIDSARRRARTTGRKLSGSPGDPGSDRGGPASRHLSGRSFSR